MTSTSGYFASPSAVVAPAPRSAWRIAVVALATAVGCPAALVVAFIAAITWSGCFLSCSASPNRVGGALLWLLSATLLFAGPTLAWLLLRTKRAVAWASLGIAGVLALVVLPLFAS